MSTSLFCSIGLLMIVYCSAQKGDPCAIVVSCEDDTYCKTDACDVTDCPTHPNAKCYSCCNTCVPVFYEGEKDVTKACLNKSPGITKKCPELKGRRKRRSAGISECSTDADCEVGQVCCDGPVFPSKICWTP